MARIDENGTVHPTENDPWSVQAGTHIAFCQECNPYALPCPPFGNKEVTGL